MSLWTHDDDTAVRLLTRIWRWRIAAMLTIAAVVVVIVLLSKV